MRKVMISLVCVVAVSVWWAGGSVSLAALTDTESEPAGWLGVVMSPLPEPLAAHLGLEDEGIMVINVAKESPAAEAGLQQYDVIVEFDQDSLSGEFAEFAEKVRVHQPGDRVKLRIIRDGEPLTVEAVLGVHPGDKSELGYCYELPPKNVIKQELKGRSRIIRRDDQGDWVIEDLGELEDFHLEPLILGLPDMKPFNRLFKSLDRTLETRIGDEHDEVTIRVTGDDETIEVTHGGGPDEPIVVTRTREEDGSRESEEKSYQDEDELAENDPEAYELFKSVRGNGHGFKFHFVSPDLEDLAERQKEWALHIQRSVEENEDVWRDAVEEALEAAREAQEEAMGRYHDARRIYEDASKHHPLLKEWRGKWGAPYLHRYDRTPETTITVQPDGEIQVTTRKGGATLKRVFRNADELREKDQRLYDKYSRLLEEEDEEEEGVQD